MAEAERGSGEARSGGRRAWAPWALAAALAGLSAITALRWSVTTDITHFLADGEDAKLAAISRDLADSELTWTWVLSIGGGDEAEVVSAARELAARLEGAPGVAWSRKGKADDGEAIHALYFPRRFYFLSDADDAAVAGLLGEAGLRGAAKELLRHLALPHAALIKKIAAEDPLLVYPAILRRLGEAQAGTLRPVEDQLVSADGQAVLFLATEASPFDGRAMAPLARAIDEAFAAVDAAHGGRLTLEQSAVARYALAAERSIRADVTRISAVSTAGLVALFVAFFGALRLVFLALLPLAFGVLAAMSVTLLLFGQIHGLTLAFGATLIGVAIDYSVHLFNHHMLEAGEGGAEGTARRIGPGLWLGALTTVAGFVGLALTSFPGLREMATFAGVGVVGAALCTRFLVPALLPARPRPARLQAAAARALGGLWAGLLRRRRALFAVPAAAAVVLALGLPRVRFVDDVRALSAVDPGMLAEDERVRGRVSRMDSGRMVIALAADEEGALARNDAVARRLTAAVAGGEVEAFRSLHSFVWSAALQERNLAALRADPTLWERLRAAFEAEGFRGEALAAFPAALASAQPPPLRLADLSGTPLEAVARSFRAEVDGEVGVVTMLRGVKDPAALRAGLAGVEGVHFFDQESMMAAAYRRYREQTIVLIGAGLGAVFAMVWLRYRRLGVALAAFAPAVVAAATTVAILGLCGVGIGLLHVVALLLVLSMGVDYGVFLAESRGDVKGLAATALSLVLACASTVLAFGLLGMSSYPALAALGTTVGLGVLLSLVLAPLTLVLLVREAGR